MERLNHRLKAKYQQVRKNEVRCEQYKVEDAEIVVIAYGISARIIRPAVDKARQAGIKAGWIRPVTLWPFPMEQINKAADQMPIFLTVELSTGQMVEDVKLAVAGKAPVVFHGRPGGGVHDRRQLHHRRRGYRRRHAFHPRPTRTWPGKFHPSSHALPRLPDRPLVFSRIRIKIEPRMEAPRWPKQK